MLVVISRAFHSGLSWCKDTKKNCGLQIFEPKIPDFFQMLNAIWANYI